MWLTQATGSPTIKASCIDDHVFLLKTYTKDWCGDDVPGTEYCVRHERDTYALLARHGLPAAEVTLARLDCDNPLGRPFIVKRPLVFYG